MRIVSGKWRGRIITPPKGLKARPTTDFAKENLFNILANSVDFEECDILDLFSGTGSITLEFASRGARSVTSVEINPLHHKFIMQSVRDFKAEHVYPVKANAFLYLKSCPKTFDIIFSDAPYDLEGSSDVIDLVFQHNLLNDEGVLIFEHSKGESYEDHPMFYKSKHYGSVNFSFFKKEQ